jgi:hypothetical protein
VFHVTGQLVRGGMDGGAAVSAEGL